LFGGRINPEPVDLSFRHSISGPLRVELLGNRLLGYGAGGRGEITLLGHIADNHVATRIGYPMIRLSESQRRYALLRAGAKFISPLEAEGFLWLFCKRIYHVKSTLRGFFKRYLDSLYSQREIDSKEEAHDKRAVTKSSPQILYVLWRVLELHRDPRDLRRRERIVELYWLWERRYRQLVGV